MKKIIITKKQMETTMVCDYLKKELPGGYKVKIMPLNRKCIRVQGGMGVTTEIFMRKDRIIIQNTWASMLGITTLLVPLGIYVYCQKEKAQQLFTTVCDTVEKTDGLTAPTEDRRDHPRSQLWAVHPLNDTQA